MIKRWILYNDEGTADKIYIVEVNKLDNGEYALTCIYGPRTSYVLNTRTFPAKSSETQVMRAAEKTVRQKMNKGYREANNLTIPGYTITKPKAIPVNKVAVNTLSDLSQALRKLRI